MEKTKMHKLTEFQFFGITFYEHPLLGDEVGYLVKKNGRYAQSDLSYKPASREEAQDAFDTATEWPA
jgi:hypothetical protein